MAGQKMQALIAIHDPSLAPTIKFIAERRGYEVVVPKSVDEAVTMAESPSTTRALMDVNYEVAAGTDYSAAKKVYAAMAERDGTKIMLVSGEDGIVLPKAREAFPEDVLMFKGDLNMNFYKDFFD